MLGVEDYGSDVESGDENTRQSPPPKPAASLTAKLPPPSKKSTFSLPPPSSSNSKPSSSGLSLPPPKKKAPKKITIGLPSLSNNVDDNAQLDDRPAKKPRLESGAGSSGLLSMLPAPKNKAPVLPAPQRVLGGGKGPGLVFKTTPSQPQSTQQASVEDDQDDDDSAPVNEAPSGTSILEEFAESKSTSMSFMPTSVKRGKANISTEERHTAPKVSLLKVSSVPAIDFFGLGMSYNSATLEVW